MDYREHRYAEAELLYNALMEPALKAAIASLNLPARSARVLDAGCGPGGVFLLLFEAIGPTGEILGVDGSETHLAKAKELVAQHQLQRAVRLEKLNFHQEFSLPRGYFDAIWVADVIFPSTIENPYDFVGRLKEALKPGGTIAIFYGNWLRPMFLPGYARLEHLICAAKEMQNAKERRWDGRLHPECAGNWLRETGFTNVRTDVLPVQYRSPLSDKAREYVGTYGLRTYYAEAIETYGDAVGLSQEDRDLWERISNPDGAGFLLDQPDYYCAAFALLTVGRKQP